MKQVCPDRILPVPHLSTAHPGQRDDGQDVDPFEPFLFGKGLLMRQSSLLFGRVRGAFHVRMEKRERKSVKYRAEMTPLKKEWGRTYPMST